MRAEPGRRYGVAAIAFVVLSVSVLSAILLLRMGGGHAEVLLAERYEFRAPAFVQARVLVHLVARAAGEVFPSVGMILIYGAIAALSTAAALMSFKRLIEAASAHTHTHTCG